MPEEKLQIAIYKINIESNLFSQTENISLFLGNHIKRKSFSLQELKTGFNHDYQIELFYKKSQSTPKWKDFLSNIAKDDQNILEIEQCYTESFVMILSNITSNNLYAVTGGFGYHAVQDFIDDNFGIDILSRLITKEDKILKSVREKSVMGGILGSTKFFRKNYNLFENDSFGKIYQELKASLDKGTLQNKFGFSSDDLKKESVCIAKASFKINKAITFEQLFKIIGGCEYVLNNLNPISVNNVKRITRKKEPKLVENLEDKLFDQLWKKYNREPGYFDFDICHKKFEEYLTASRYIVRRSLSKVNFFGEFEFEKLENIDELFEEIKKLENKPENKDEFIKLIKLLKIYSYDDEDQMYPLTKGWLLYHIFGDVSFENQKYFLIDHSWYKIEDDFIKILNDSCKSFIENNYNNNLDKSWNYHSGENENSYNVKYLSKSPLTDKIIVLDKITPENIELCDILKWDNKNLYFYHVKAGFGNTMRDLCSQVFIAANKIINDVNFSKEYIGKIYDELANKMTSPNEYFNKIGKQTLNITKDEFIKLFIDRQDNFIFVLSVLDSATNERNLKTDMHNLGSSIAKFSLQELIKSMRGINVKFEFVQIFKEN